MSLLKLENISYNYDKRDTPVLKDINYEIIGVNRRNNEIIK